MNLARGQQLRGRRGGFTLVEVSVCVVIVGVMLAAVMQTVGQSSVMQFRLAERSRAAQLARSMMAEILAQPYQDALVATTTLGPEPGELRATYDDIDDYNGLTESPPTAKDGTSLNLPSASTWRRSVSVAWVTPTTLASSATESGLKKITVSVYHRGTLVYTLSALKGNAP